LQVTKSETSPIDVKVSYQWTRGPIEIVGATGSEYLLSTADFGSRLSVVVIFKRKGFTTNSVYTNFIETPNFKRNYIETWREDFNMEVGSYPQSKIWTPDVGDGSNTAAGGGWGNRERQYYIPEQAKTNQFGELVIQATRKNASNYSCYYREACEWISAKYTTKGKIGFKYGRIEARIKGPLGLGTWGAFWMLGADIDERRWPWCGEIDVTELVGKDPNIAYGYLHGLLSGGMGGRGSTVPIPGGFADDFHVYAIDWLPDQINWYVDDVLFGSQSKIDRDWVFDHEFYLIFNLAMGGNLGGPIDLNLESAEMKLDWIRFSTINGIGEVIRHS
jgi:beta-glucanase (GH16 family)